MPLTRFSERKVYRSSIHVHLGGRKERNGDDTNTTGEVEKDSSSRKALHARKVEKVPVFLIRPRQLFVNDGETAKFSTSSTGPSSNRVEWFFNSKHIKGGNKYKIFQENGCHHLEVTMATAEDHGEYTCTLETLAGSTSATAFLHVQEEIRSKGHNSHIPSAPCVELPLIDAYYPEGTKDATLICKFTNAHDTHASWFKNGKELKHWQASTHFDGQTAKLVIGEVSKKSCGIYECAIVNSKGKAKTRCSVGLLDPLIKPRPPKFILPLNDQIVESDATVSLVTKVTGSPPPTLIWYRDNQRLETSSQGVVAMETKEGEGHLVLEKVTQGSKFTCIAKNVAGQERTDALLTVTDSTEVKEPPIFIKELKDMEIKDGERVEMSVEVKGTPPIDIVWVHNNREIPPTDPVCRMVSDGNVHQLLIPEVFPEDEGEYVCEAYNAYGDTDTFCRLKVHEENSNNNEGNIHLEDRGPEFIQPPPSQLTVALETSVKVTCEVDGEPLPSVQWYFESAKLRHGSKYKTTSVGQQHTLEITDVTLKDSGQYTCTLANPVGRVSSVSTVTVVKEAPPTNLPIGSAEADLSEITQKSSEKCSSGNGYSSSDSIKILSGPRLNSGATVGTSDELISSDQETIVREKAITFSASQSHSSASEDKSESHNSTAEKQNISTVSNKSTPDAGVIKSSELISTSDEQNSSAVNFNSGSTYQNSSANLSATSEGSVSYKTIVAAISPVTRQSLAASLFSARTNFSESVTVQITPKSSVYTEKLPSASAGSAVSENSSLRRAASLENSPVLTGNSSVKLSGETASGDSPELSSKSEERNKSVLSENGVGLKRNVSSDELITDFRSVLKGRSKDKGTANHTSPKCDRKPPQLPEVSKRPNKFSTPEQYQPESSTTSSTFSNTDSIFVKSSLKNQKDLLTQFKPGELDKSENRFLKSELRSNKSEIKPSSSSPLTASLSIENSRFSERSDANADAAFGKSVLTSSHSAKKPVKPFESSTEVFDTPKSRKSFEKSSNDVSGTSVASGEVFGVKLKPGIRSGQDSSDRSCEKRKTSDEKLVQTPKTADRLDNPTSAAGKFGVILKSGETVESILHKPDRTSNASDFSTVKTPKNSKVNPKLVEKKVEGQTDFRCVLKTTGGKIEDKIKPKGKGLDTKGSVLGQSSIRSQALKQDKQLSLSQKRQLFEKEKTQSKASSITNSNTKSEIVKVGKLNTVQQFEKKQPSEKETVTDYLNVLKSKNQSNNVEKGSNERSVKSDFLKSLPSNIEHARGSSPGRIGLKLDIPVRNRSEELLKLSGVDKANEDIISKTTGVNSLKKTGASSVNKLVSKLETNQVTAPVPVKSTIERISRIVHKMDDTGKEEFDKGKTEFGNRNLMDVTKDSKNAICSNVVSDEVENAGFTEKEVKKVKPIVDDVEKEDENEPKENSDTRIRGLSDDTDVVNYEKTPEGPTTADNLDGLCVSKMPNETAELVNEEQDIAEEVPVMGKGLENTCVEYGRAVTLECEVTGPPDTEILWMVNNTKIKPSKYFQMTYDACVARLMIAEAFSEDEGEYKCTASNSNGSTSTSCRLKVQERSVSPEHEQIEEPFSPIATPPKIYNISPSEFCILRGSVIEFKASYTSVPQGTVTWSRNREKLTSGDRIKIDTSDLVSTLTLTNIQPCDSGRYNVVVMNDLGTDASFASLTVQDVPEPPVGQPCVNDLTETSVILSWSGPAYDGGCPVTNYRVEMCDAEDNEWLPVTNCCEHTSCHIEDLTPHTPYFFRVFAENKHGLSLPCQTTEVTVTRHRRPSLQRLQSTESDDVFTHDTNDVCTPLSAYDIVSPLSPDEIPFEHRPVVFTPGRMFEDSYITKEEIGRGKFGCVYKCEEKSTGNIWAAKVLKCREAEKQKIGQEVEIMNELQHPKILLLWDVFEAPRKVILVMEYIGGGELFERVLDDDFDLLERDCIQFLRQIVDAVHYMHGRNILHLDLKPENILCVKNESNKIKIIDFGLARFYRPGESVRVLFGTPEFIAPEVVNYDEIGFTTDMWSIGVICYVLLSGLSPFMGDSDTETLSNVTQGEFDFDDEAFEAVSDDGKNFVEQLLVKNKSKRLTSEQALKHRWLAPDTAKMKSRRINTSNLKRFMLRRKWQKTGTAIRALGRMTSLQKFSRLNSPSSPTANENGDGSSSSLDSPSNQSGNSPLGSCDSQKSCDPGETSHNHRDKSCDTVVEADETDEVDSSISTAFKVSASTCPRTDSSNATITGTQVDHSSGEGEEQSRAKVGSTNTDTKSANKCHGQKDLRNMKNHRKTDINANDEKLSDSANDNNVNMKSDVNKNASKLSEQSKSNSQTNASSPQFLKTMIDSNAFPGDAVRFDIEYDTDCDCEVMWYFEDSVIKPGPRHSIVETAFGSQSLVIKDVCEADDGEYLCKIINKAGEEVCSADLIVYGAI